MVDRMKCTLQLHSHKILMVVWNCGCVFICALDPTTLKQSQHFILLIHCFVSANITLFPCSISQRPLSFALCLADREDGPTLNGVFIYKQKPTNPSNYSPKRTLKHIPDLISSNYSLGNHLRGELRLLLRDGRAEGVALRDPVRLHRPDHKRMKTL